MNVLCKDKDNLDHFGKPKYTEPDQFMLAYEQWMDGVQYTCLISLLTIILITASFSG